MIKISHIKNSVSLFLLALFITMKMLGLHVLAHADDSDHDLDCVTCEYTITYNLTPILNSDLQNFIIENAEFIFQREVTKNYSFIEVGTISKNELFSRPPPFLL